MSKFPVAPAIPAELFNLLGALKFIKEEIILQFGSENFILNENDFKFDCKVIEYFARDKKFNENIPLLTTQEVVVLLN